MISSNIDLGNPVSDHPLNRGLVSWWLPLPNNKGGSRLFDLKGGNHGALTNGSTWSGGWNSFGAIRLWPISASYVATSAAVSGSPGFSVTAFLRDSLGLFGFGYKCPLAFISPSYHLLAVQYGGAMTIWGAGSAVGTFPTDQGWHALTWTHAAGSDSVYLDGVLVGTATSSHFDSATLSLGGRSDQNQTWDGEFQSCQLHSRPLSASEVAFLHDQCRRGFPDVLRRSSAASFSVQGFRFGVPGASLAGSVELSVFASIGVNPSNGVVGGASFVVRLGSGVLSCRSASGTAVLDGGCAAVAAGGLTGFGESSVGATASMASSGRCSAGGVLLGTVSATGLAVGRLVVAGLVDSRLELVVVWNPVTLEGFDAFRETLESELELSGVVRADLGLGRLREMVLTLSRLLPEDLII